MWDVHPLCFKYLDRLFFIFDSDNNFSWNKNFPPILNTIHEMMFFYNKGSIPEIIDVHRFNDNSLSSITLPHSHQTLLHNHLMGS